MPLTGGASRVALDLLFHTCRRHYPGGLPRRFALLVWKLRPSLNLSQVGSRIARFEACSAFTHVTACMLAKSPFATLYTRGFGDIVTSITAPIASGWSDSCRVGFAPTGDRRLSRRTEKHGLGVRAAEREEPGFIGIR